MWSGVLDTYTKHKKSCAFGEGALSEEVRKNFFISDDSASKPVLNYGVKARIYAKNKDKIDNMCFKKQKIMDEFPQLYDSSDENEVNDMHYNWPEKVKNESESQKSLQSDECENEEEYEEQLKLALEMSLKENL